MQAGKTSGDAQHADYPSGPERHVRSAVVNVYRSCLMGSCLYELPKTSAHFQGDQIFRSRSDWLAGCGPGVVRRVLDKYWVAERHSLNTVGSAMGLQGRVMNVE